MADNNINGMKAQDWKLLDTSRIDAVADQQTKLTVEQRQLVDAIAAVVKAAAEDIHGTTADDKYRYIVDLIVKRVKAVVDNAASEDSTENSNISKLEEIGDKFEDILESKSLKDVFNKIPSLMKSLSGLDLKGITQSIKAALTDASFEDSFCESMSKKLSDSFAAAKSRDTDAASDAVDDIKQMLSSKQNADQQANSQAKNDAAKISSTLNTKIAESMQIVQKKLQTHATANVAAFKGAKVGRDPTTGRFISMKKAAAIEDTMQLKQSSEDTAAAASTLKQASERLSKKQKNTPKEDIVLTMLASISKKLSEISAALARRQSAQLPDGAEQSTTRQNIKKATAGKAAVAAAAVLASAGIRTAAKHKEESTSTSNNADNAQSDANGIEQRKKDKEESRKAASGKHPIINAVSSAFSKLLKPISNAVASIGGMVTKISKKVLGKATNALFAALMTPPGMYAIGFIAGYVWGKWLKKWVVPIMNIVSKMSKSKLIAMILGAAGIAGLAALVLPAVLPMLMSGLLPAIGSLVSGLFTTVLPAVMSALPVLAPIAMIAGAVFAAKKAIDHLNEASAAREEGIQKDNETTAKVIKAAKVQAQTSKEIRQKLDAMEDSDEKTAALEERLDKLRKTRALYKKLEQQEQEAQEERMKLNAGFRKFIASAEEIKHWQDKENSLREQKMKLLQEQGFAESDMRQGKAARWSKDGMNEEQRLATKIAEASVKKTGQLSKDAYQTYAKAFGMSQTGKAYEKNKDELARKLSNAADSPNMQHPMQKKEVSQQLDEGLQDKVKAQQNAIEEVSESNEKIADAVQQSSKDQKEASQLIIEKLDTLLSQHVYQPQSSTTNNVTVVSAPAQHNLASIENGTAMRIM